MSVTRNIVKGVVKAIERAVEFGSSILKIVFNGTDQYATHSAWTPTGANFTQSVKYTPYAGAMGSAVTILGDHLTKNASDQLVYSYTDTAAGSQAVTLTAVTLAADTEYTIDISSDGNGITLAIGSDEATNSAVVDPSTLSFETWMRDSGGTDYNNGIVSDIEFTDLSLIQDGDFLEGDGTAREISIPEIDLGGTWTVVVHAVRTSAAGGEDAVVGYDSANNAFLLMKNNNDILFRSSATAQTATWIGALANIGIGQHYIAEFSADGSAATLSIDGAPQGSRPLSDTTLVIDRLMSSDGRRYRTGLFTVDINDGEYTFLLNNITDNGDGTGTAPNTGNSEGAELFSPTIIQDGWTDNGDGSYSWDTNSVKYLIVDNVLEIGKMYRLSFRVTAHTGSTQIGFSNSGFGGDASERSLTDVGEIDTVLEATGTLLRVFVNASAGTGTITDISAIETYYGTVNDYDPLTDLVTVANNTRNYPVNVDSETQPDILNPGGGNDATIVNYRPDMVISSFNELGEEESADPDWTDLTGGVWQLVTTGDADYLTFTVVPGVAYYVTYTIVSLVGTGTFSALDDTTPIAGLTTTVIGVHIATHTFANSVIRFARGSGSDVFTGVISNIQIVRV